MILGGDIGGTKSNLALFRLENGRPTPVHEKTFVSREFNGLEELTRTFLAQVPKGEDTGEISAAAFGIAGPVVGDICETPNLPWVINATIFGHRLGVEKVKLINDLEANAFGIPLLSESEFVALNDVKGDPNGNAALISAGTGLGEALLIRNSGGELIPVASEGGHCTFAPRNELEIELLRYLMKSMQWGHVSYERVVSGQGLLNVYRFLRDTGRGEEPSWLTEELRKGDPPAVISQLAMSERSELCSQALDICFSIYGSEAGNLALKVKALGGLYVGGGIAPKNISRLKNGPFMKSFADKGRMSSLLSRIPVKVIMNPKTALLGAGRCASLL